MYKRIYNLLLPKERSGVLKMAISVLVSALLDFAGLAALLPALYFLMEDVKHNQAALFFSIIALSVIVVKCFTITFLTKYQNRYLLEFYKRLSFDLFSSYYKRGLLFIREHGSIKLSHEINAMCYAFSFNLIYPLCRLVGDFLLIAFVTIYLLFWNRFIVMLLFIAFIPLMCFYFFYVRGRIIECGINDMNAKRKQARVVMDTMRGYLELEVNSAFPLMKRVFLEGMENISDSRIKLDTFLRLPQLLTEISAVIGIIVILFTRSGDVKFVIGIFAVTALRLLPVLKAILVGWTQIQNSICCLDTIEEGLKGYENETPYKKVDIKFANNLSVENLYYAYPNGGYIFSGLNFVVNKGEYVGICGASGIGKTTLFNLIVGLIKQDAGEIKVDGIPISKDMYASWIQMISYVPQDVFIFNGSLAENIALGSNNIDTEKINDIIHKVGLDELVASLHFGIDASLGECGVKLSGGEKQRIGIARALYKNAQLLLLDEATSALDNDMEKEINLIIKRLRSDNRGLTILSIAHRESSLSYCDRIINLKRDGVEQNI